MALLMSINILVETVFNYFGLAYSSSFHPHIVSIIDIVKIGRASLFLLCAMLKGVTPPNRTS